MKNNYDYVLDANGVDIFSGVETKPPYTLFAKVNGKKVKIRFCNLDYLSNAIEQAN